MATPPTEPERSPRNRFGLRAKLLALLLPGLVALLAFDSWHDYHAMAETMTGTHGDLLNQWLRQALWRDVRTLLVVALLLWIGVAWMLRPLERLRASLEARRPGDLQPLDVRDVPQEVVPLVEAVNHHIEDHRRMLAEQSQFLADASHQLRTPLAILSIQAGYAVRESDPERMRESLHAIVAQLARTRRLSEQLLALAHATQEDDGSSRPTATVDLGAVARGVVLQYLPLAREHEQDLGWMDESESETESETPDDPAALPVQANEAELHEVLSNLVHNAIQYTPRGGTITVSVRRDAPHALAEVCDSGPGIAPARRDAVFERFQRESRDAPKGAGLGLAIARGYARRNRGDIELHSAQDGGLRAILRLPLAQP
ncbi:MAG: HAMP domain-containing histidine kinase [Comamonadaceae bacterium]|nr:MAG: HAMP domain-containing histidine kinase [Comamonadaceae bacterium]